MDHHMPVKRNEIHVNVKWHILLSMKLAISLNTLYAMWGDFTYLFGFTYRKKVLLSVYLVNGKKGYK